MTDKVSNVLVTDVSFRCNPGLESLETDIQTNESFLKKLTTLCENLEVPISMRKYAV